MNCRTANDGVWVVPAYQATTFAAKGTMTWTVEQSDVITWAYTRIGNTIIASFTLANTSVGGTPTDELWIMLPASLRAARNVVAPYRLVDNGTFMMGFALVGVDADRITLKKLDNSSFQVSTNATNAYGQLTFEALD